MITSKVHSPNYSQHFLLCGLEFRKQPQDTRSQQLLKFHDCLFQVCYLLWFVLFFFSWRHCSSFPWWGLKFWFCSSLTLNWINSPNYPTLKNMGFLARAHLVPRETWRPWDLQNVSPSPFWRQDLPSHSTLSSCLPSLCLTLGQYSKRDKSAGGPHFSLLSSF